MNLAHRYVLESAKCIAGTREEYDGACIDFAGECAEKYGGKIAYFDTPLNPRWRYHAAMILNEVIHDLWEEEPIPVRPFMDGIGASSMELF